MCACVYVMYIESTTTTTTTTTNRPHRYLQSRVVCGRLTSVNRPQLPQCKKFFRVAVYIRNLLTFFKGCPLYDFRLNGWFIDTYKTNAVVLALKVVKTTTRFQASFVMSLKGLIFVSVVQRNHGRTHAQRSAHAWRSAYVQHSAPRVAHRPHTQ